MNQKIGTGQRPAKSSLSFFSKLFVSSLLPYALVACSSAPIDLRIPASTPVYNNEKIRLLKKTADAGILFQISDAALRDVPSKQVTERCRKVEDPMWSEKLFETLQTITGSAGFSKKLHILEFKRGDAPKVEITKDLLDGVTYLQISYGKIETREKVKKVENLPCAEKPLDLMDQELITVEYNWPSKGEIFDALLKAPDRPESDRFKFDNSFIMFLAERQTLFRLNPDIAFERSAAGHNLLRAFMAKMSGDVKEKATFQNLDFWLHELSLKSKQASNVKFFSLRKEAGLAHGIQVDSGGKFARKIGGFSDPSYLYVSYKSENGAFFLPSLKDLDQCLSQLSSIAGSMEYKNNFDLDADSFLYPGHHCQLSETATASRVPASDPIAAPIIFTPAPEVSLSTEPAAAANTSAASGSVTSSVPAAISDESANVVTPSAAIPSAVAPPDSLETSAASKNSKAKVGTDIDAAVNELNPVDPANSKETSKSASGSSVTGPTLELQATPSPQVIPEATPVPAPAQATQPNGAQPMPASVPAAGSGTTTLPSSIPVEKAVPHIEKLELPPIIDVMDPTQTRPN